MIGNRTARAAISALAGIMVLAGCQSSGDGTSSFLPGAPGLSSATEPVTVPDAAAVIPVVPVVTETVVPGAPAAPLVSGHHAVIAQGLVGFAAGEFHWEFATSTVTATPSTFSVADPTFILSDAPDPVLVGTTGNAPAWRLGPGEAALHRGGGTVDATSVSPNGGTLVSISPAPGSGPNSFTPGEGFRDVDLVRDVLSTNEVLLLQTEVSALVLVTSGAVDGGGTTIVPGAPVAVSGNVTLFNLSAEPAVVVVAVIGQAAEAAAPPPMAVPETMPPPATSTPKPQPQGTTPPTTAPATTTTTSTTMPPTTTTTTTTMPPVVDTDSDGLSDGDEAKLGTDPKKADTDLDGIPDGREVNALKSNPLKTDTDGDGLTDGRELDKSCDLLKRDTDGDGLEDAFEANSGFSECALADTDDDGHDDLDEFSNGTDPRDPNSHVLGA